MEIAILVRSSRILQPLAKHINFAFLGLGNFPQINYFRHVSLLLDFSKATPRTVHHEVLETHVVTDTRRARFGTPL